MSSQILSDGLEFQIRSKFNDLLFVELGPLIHEYPCCKMAVTYYLVSSTPRTCSSHAVIALYR